MSNHTHTWDSITNRPSTFTPSSHNHNDLYYTESEVNSLLSYKLNNTAIQYTVDDPGDNTTSSLPDNTLICVYEEV